MNRVGLTLQEEAFCQLVALGKSGVDAYEEAFGRPAVDDRQKRLYTKRASNLAKRVDIAARIVEAKGEQKRRDREKWEARGNEIADALYGAISGAFEHKNENGRPMILERDTLKGIEILTKMKGLNAPEQTVLKNGGLSDDFIPRGMESVSDEDLKRILEAEPAIDVEPSEGGAS